MKTTRLPVLLSILLCGCDITPNQGLLVSFKKQVDNQQLATKQMGEILERYTAEPYHFEWRETGKLLIKFPKNSKVTSEEAVNLANEVVYDLRRDEAITLQVPQSLLGVGEGGNSPDIHENDEESYLITLDWNDYGAKAGLFSVADIIDSVDEGERYPSYLEIDGERYTFDALCGIRLPMKSGMMNWGNMAWGAVPSMDFRYNESDAGFSNRKISGLEGGFVYMLYYSYPVDIYLITSINTIPSPSESALEGGSTLRHLLDSYVSNDEECYDLLEERSSGDMSLMLPNHRAAKFNVSGVESYSTF